MVALLVLATFVLFIAVDVLLHREKYQFQVESAEAKPIPRQVSSPVVAGVALPEMLAYHPGHTWARDEGDGRIRVGIDEFAACLIAGARKVETSPRGRWVRQGAKGWSIATPQGCATMLSPVDGEIVAVNEKVISDPELLSKDPYGEGWLIELRAPDFAVNLRNLMTGNFARRWMEESVESLAMAFSPAMARSMADGGRLAPGLARELPAEKWSALTRQYFLS